MVKPKLFLGLSAVGILLTSVLFAGKELANEKEGLINDALKLSTQKVTKIDNDDVEGSAYTEEDGSLSNDQFYKMIKDSYAFCEEAVEQGSALLKNENNCLPLKSNERKVTLFGQGSKNLFMRSGAGGAAPNDDLVVKLDRAFKDNGFKINETVFNKYGTVSEMTTPSTTVESAAKVCKSATTAELLDDVKASCDDYNDAAIVTFVRIGTENTDPPKGKLDLNSDEATLLKAIKASGKFQKTIVIINSPLPMSMDWANNDEYGVDAIVYMGVPGYYGVGGICHVLTGEKVVDGKTIAINPSGHLVDTFAASASSSAAYQNFGNNSVVVYKEGVYVGYKYYETRYEDCILGEGNADGTAGTYINKEGWSYKDEMGYPFGYGLSYTTFEQKILDVAYDATNDEYNVEVEVKNTGAVDGKSSIQVYVQEPYTQFDKGSGLGKAAIQLMGYEKVDVEAGATVKKTVTFPRYFLTTYDYITNKSYILEGGDYYFALGNGAHEALNNVLGVKAADKADTLIDHNGDKYVPNTDAVKKVTINQDLKKYVKSVYNADVEVTNQFDDADYNYYVDKNHTQEAITYLDRQNWQGTWPTPTTASPASSADLNMASKYATTEEREEAGSYKAGDGIDYNVDLGEKITFTDMMKVPLEGKVTEGKFAGRYGEDVWEEFISQMTLDDLVISVSDNRGILDVLKVLKKGNSVAEGPEGLLSTFKYGDNRWATGFPTGPTYTGTWDHQMQKNFGGFYGEEAIYCGVACVNAPGANINRTPYGSRASEYMSEDGILNYYTASNVIGQARKKGLIMNIKHCFLNNQETGRQRVQTYCNEQAIREIYLKPFEGALTRGHGLGIMTSYNRIGAVYAACHKPLMMNVMRGEWNYKGLIIDDALTGGNTDQYSNGPAMLYSGTDLFCLDGGRGGQLKSWVNDNDDMLALKCLQRANKYIMYSISRSWMGGIRVTEEELQESINPWWKKTINGICAGTTCVSGALLAAYIVLEFLEKKTLLGA